MNRADLDGIQPRPGFLRLFPIAGQNPRVGIDVAGEVDAVGGGVTTYAPGDRVFADRLSSGGGSFAEYVAAPAKAFLPIPAGMSFEIAATLPHSAVLAIQGLRRRDGTPIGPGDNVLIDGASGNVGPFAVQIARRSVPRSPRRAGPRRSISVRLLGAPSHRLHAGRLHANGRALRLDPRYRFTHSVRASRRCGRRAAM